MTTRIVQFAGAPPDDDKWEAYNLSEGMLRQVLALVAGGRVRIPDVGGAATYIVNKDWRGYTMHQIRFVGDERRKRGVRDWR